MRRRALTVAALTMLTMVPAGPVAAGGRDANRGTDDGLTLAIYGDAPYGTTPADTAELAATPAFIESINADPDVRGVVHVGDIHSGKQFCTEAYDRSIYDLWTQFADPLVYTPGDNEWADCHKAAQGGGVYNPATGAIDPVLDPLTQQPVDYAAGDPVANLQLIRSIFFSRPGRTLGGGDGRVLSQAQLFDPRHRSDRQYVENVLWEQHGVVFVTINVPGGSNNDADPWYKAPVASAAQLQESADRTGADLRWLDTAFTLARLSRAAGVVIVAQADMWDLDGNTSAHLTNYEPIVASVAAHTTAFKRPVLMFNGDSHVYRSDNPLSATAPCTTELADGSEAACASDYPNHPGYAVTNFHRIVVHGSTFPLEWLKLVVDDHTAPGGADTFGPFSWTRVPQPTS
ncbi:MAG: hypothetical protein JWM12_3394 [Ilumatobacteraceae bacterium]|nr:hypothetical protein [Ilumatobacteraceae bacterium]